MGARTMLRRGALLPGLVFAVAVAVSAPLNPSVVDWAVQTCLLGVPVVTGLLLHRRVPGSPVGAALSWVGAAPAAVFAVESWGATVLTGGPWPAARWVYTFQLGAWVWNLAGFVALCLVFPDGMLPGRRWRFAVAYCVAAALSVHAVVSLLRPVSGDYPPGLRRPGLEVPDAVFASVAIPAFCAALVALGLAVGSLVVRYRAGGETVRTQLRWLVLGAGTVPVLLAGGWIAELFGTPVDLAYLGFLAAMLLAVPAAIAVAVVRHDLFDIDRLLGTTLAWIVTSVLSAAIFAGVVFAIADAAGGDSRVGLTGAAFVTAMCLLPLHRLISELVGRVVDRERTVTRARVEQFVRQVRGGTAQPEETEAVLRTVLGDPGLRLLVRLPGSAADRYVDPAGEPSQVAPGAVRVPLTTSGTEVGVIVLGLASARRLRRAREAAVQARLPIEVSRLRLELRRALDETRAGQARLALAGAAERQRLARDLHDGAQQQLIAVGMRLRSVQRGIAPDQPAHQDLETAVTALGDTVADLRRLAHGVRPSRLEDGLAAALRALATDSSVPVTVTVPELDPPEVVATTAYFVVAEALTNAMKHAQATGIGVVVRQQGGGLRIEVSDNGVGGARPGFGLTSVRDRVLSIGGELTVHSPAGGGTTIAAVI
ncbi:histidine kinase [Actinoplanes sp. NPDC048967]|uniref:sensor histidine kinase n=1 Tax=Actinoplanes sp. NPDC048967 TaxID=3155269 RepID=UPI0033DBE5EA